MSEFITLLPPPGDALSAWDPTKRSKSQPSSIPQPFLDAMAVRHTVFVDEQLVPIENEQDPDDARSFHWIVYASVGQDGKSNEPNNQSGAGEHKERDASASKVPVGTIRLVPPPHPPHPEPGSHHKADNAEDLDLTSKTRRTSLHNGHEPYIKLGRLATLKEYRGQGLSKLLVTAALRWASENATSVLPPPEPAAAEAAKLEGKGDEDLRWRGLVLVHAQADTGRTVGLWERYGFKIDEGMGEWDEEGILHVGMWRRLDVKE